MGARVGMLYVRVQECYKCASLRSAILQRSELVVLSPSGHAVFGKRGNAGYNSRWNESQRDPYPRRSSCDALLQLGSKTLSLEAGSELAVAHVLPSHAYGAYQIPPRNELSNPHRAAPSIEAAQVKGAQQRAEIVGQQKKWPPAC